MIIPQCATIIGGSWHYMPSLYPAEITSVNQHRCGKATMKAHQYNFPRKLLVFHIYVGLRLVALPYINSIDIFFTIESILDMEY